MEIRRKYNFTLRAYYWDSFRLRLRVQYYGYRIEFSTKCFVMTKEAWDSKNNVVKQGYLGPKGEKPADQNREITRLIRDMEDCFKFFEVLGRVPTDIEFREYYEDNFLGRIHKEEIDQESFTPSVSNGKSGNKLTFWEVYDRFVADNGIKNAWTEATYKKFATLKTDLKSFRPTLKFEDLTENGLTKFVSYLRDHKIITAAKKKKGQKGKAKTVQVGVTNTTIAKKLGYFKWFMKWATLQGYNNNLAYQGFKITLKGTQRKVIFLTKDELDKIKYLDIPLEHAKLDRVRDVFLFCCFSGLRYSDTYNLRKGDIINDMIEVTTVKTADSLRIELNDVTRRILNKYKYVDLPEGKALPVVSNQKMNDSLKELCKMAGINSSVRITTYKGSTRTDEIYPKYELIGTHTGRRTFICHMLSLGVPADVVMKWTGHSDYKAMKPYIDIVDSIKASEMSKINILDK